MARQLQGIERGLRLVAENSFSGVDVLFGSGVPGASGDPSTASVGSLYMRSDVGSVYFKLTAGVGVDKWVKLSDASDLNDIKFRSEKVTAATGDAAPVEGATVDAGAFSDDDAPNLSGSDFLVGEHVIFGVGGTPVIGEITNIATDDLTISYLSVTALTDGFNYVVKHYLPDSPDGQEKQALVHYDTNAIIKIGDVNWDFADGINMASGYTAANGTISSADSVNSAIEKLDGNQLDLITLTGVAVGSVDMGTYTGSILTDNQVIKVNIQELETALELVQDNSLVRTSADAVTTAVTLDSVLVDDKCAIQWDIVYWLDSAPERKQAAIIYAFHDGTASADATNADSSISYKLKLGATFDHDISVDLNGAAGSQEFRLRIAAAAAISIRATRIDVDC